ncbi:MAG TPA: DUF1566 domain-containing protein [bacterium]|nr:DUF1566 domain-containing protein [bacterium]
MRKYLLIHALITSFVFLITSINHAEEPRITLRSSYRDLSVSEVQSMFNFSIHKMEDMVLFGYSTVNHNYKKKSINGDRVVIDYATGLMWHQSGSDKYMNWSDAKKWVQKLNKIGYAGYKNWRLPTVEEAASLLESSVRKGLYIDAVFSNRQEWIWTGDKYGSEGVWVVHFLGGYMYWVYFSNENDYDARPVRSVK